MAWTAPFTYTVGLVLTAANLNTYLRDNFLAVSLHTHTGAAGDGAAFSDAIHGSRGASLHSDAHARSHAITGTSDHTSAATSGRMLKADASGLPVNATNIDTDVADAVTKKHVEGHTLASHSTKAHAELTNVTADQHHPQVHAHGNYGSYAGDNTVNRAIAHGLGVVPTVVLICNLNSMYWFRISRANATILFCLQPAETSGVSVSELNSTNFYVGATGGYLKSANASGEAYYWIAIG